MLFASYIKPIQEVEVDGEDQSGGEQSTDYTADADEGTGTPAPEDQTQNQGAEDQNQDNAQGDENQDASESETNEEPTDYTEMGDDGGDGTEEGGGDEGSDDATPVSSDEEAPVDDIKKQEEELYANLTPQQLDIKHEELKNQYLAMFDMVNSIIERIGDTSTSEENIPVIEYVSKQLADLQSMLTDYMNFSYKTKSYIENSINYNRFIAVLNGINKILEEMNKKDTE